MLTDSFPAEIACIAETVETQPGLRGDSFIREYLLTGQMLAEQVRCGFHTCWGDDGFIYCNRF